MTRSMHVLLPAFRQPRASTRRRISVRECSRAHDRVRDVLDRDANATCPGRHAASRTRRLVRTLTRAFQVVVVSCFLGGCALVDDLIFPDFGPDFGILRGLGKGIGSIVEAGTAAVRPLEQLGKGMDQVGEMATELDRTLRFGRESGTSAGDQETGTRAGASSTESDEQADECAGSSSAYGRPGQHMTSKRCPGRCQSNGGSYQSLGR